MKIYNTLSKQIEDFIPYEGNKVMMYTCGPTVYHYAHIGNLRTYIFEDVLEKSLLYLGYDVKRVMNITDVGHLTSDSDTGEDKMLKGALREHKTVYEIADFYTKAFFDDAKKLNIAKPSIVEKASDHIDQYIKMITKLLETGHAYIANGNVYFDISKANDYYKLSGKNSEELIVGVRETVEEDKNKKNPADFVLWFTISKFENQAMQWDSPWGRGYPGWHIECSGISLKYLGEYLDIHCGGVDNIFPHHTNEIAQTEGYLGHKWCNYWCHGEHLNDSTGKMSKSNGEFLTLSLLESKGYNPLVYRLFCLQSHYRRQLVFSYEGMDNTNTSYTKLLGRIKNIKDSSEGEINKEVVEKYQGQFKEALENDLNTSLALTTLYDVLKDDVNTNTKLYLIKDFDKVLSLDLLKEKEIDDDLTNYINEMIEKRNEAKENKEYEKADQIREELLSKGIIIKDTREGTIFEIK
ncbi:MAG: cysteine--tRNA ligase [Ignavibacteriales bacterium]